MEEVVQGKILLVDDDPLSYQAVKSILTNRGYEVVIAKDGREGLEKTHGDIFDLIISDVQMPTLNGLEMIRAIRKAPEYRHIPVIFLSGLHDVQVQVSGIEVGGDDYIVKPAKKDVLLAKVAQAIKRHQLIKHERQLKHFWNEKHGEVQIALVGNETHWIAKHFPNSAKTYSDLSTYKEAFLDNNFWITILGQGSYLPDVGFLQEFREQTQFLLMGNSQFLNDILPILNASKIKGLLNSESSREQIVYEIKGRLEAQQDQRRFYLNSLNEASQNSPIRSAPTFDETFGKWRVSIFHEPYDGLPGGDFYDIFPLDEKRQIIAIGDVMGKKWDAWYFVPAYLAYLRSTLRFFQNHRLEEIKDLSELLNLINSYLCKDLIISNVFSTLLLVYIDSEKEAIRISPAGFTPPIVVGNNTCEEVDIKGMLLGILQGNQYSSKKVHLASGQKFIASTDGFSEITYKDNLLTDEEYNDFFRNKLGHGGSSMSAKDLDEAFASHFELKKYDDDRTMLIIEKL